MRQVGQSTYVAADKGKTPAQLIYEKCLGQRVDFGFTSAEVSPPNRHVFTMHCDVNGTVSINHNTYFVYTVLVALLKSTCCFGASSQFYW